MNFASLLAALRAAGHRVAVLTGASSDHPNQQDWQDKAHYLTSLGMANDWDTLVVFPNPPHKPKAKWCRKNAVSILFENDAKNAKFAAEYCTVILPWQSIIPQKLKEKA